MTNIKGVQIRPKVSMVQIKRGHFHTLHYKYEIIQKFLSHIFCNPVIGIEEHIKIQF